MVEGVVRAMMDKPKILGVIPARLDSQRLPGKVMLAIGQKPMVHWVYERARQSNLLNELIVATDNEQVHDYCTSHDLPVLLTGRHPSGSDRVYEVMDRTDGDIYINIQGDEPTIRAEHVDLLLRPLLQGLSEVSTLKVAIDPEAARDPNVVKVVTGNDCRALYFSRAPIPFNRDGKTSISYYKHIGLYGYTRAALKRFHALPQSSLELAEKLEQLRYLENGIAIYVAETARDTIGVDTAEDLERARSYLMANS
jgi:3-deoxy-manno-octulosonate cytidylyltransferase (CMP-KDO synthetase)